MVLSDAMWVLLFGGLGLLLFLWIGIGPRILALKAKLSISLFVGAVVAAILGMQAFTRRDRPIPPPARVRYLKEDWKLFDLRAQTFVSLSDFAGKVLFINQWATYCPPCVAEMPSIEALYQAFKDNPNVAFLIISHDSEPALPLEFAGQRKLTMPLYMAASPPPASLYTRGIPSTFLIGKDGKFEAAVPGAQDWNMPSVHNVLRRLAEAEIVKSASKGSTEIQSVGRKEG